MSELDGCHMYDENGDVVYFFSYLSFVIVCVFDSLIPPIEIFVIYSSLPNFLHINISKDYQLSDIPI